MYVRIAGAMEHEHTQHIAAAPDEVFAVLGDVNRLPEFVPQMTGAHAGDGDTVVVTPSAATSSLT